VPSTVIFSRPDAHSTAQVAVRSRDGLPFAVEKVSLDLPGMTARYENLVGHHTYKVTIEIEDGLGLGGKLGHLDIRISGRDQTRVTVPIYVKNPGVLGSRAAQR
jgi:hypothetical protein